jgi:hypothetical protein
MNAFDRSNIITKAAATPTRSRWSKVVTACIEGDSADLCAAVELSQRLGLDGTRLEQLLNTSRTICKTAEMSHYADTNTEKELQQLLAEARTGEFQGWDAPDSITNTQRQQQR